MEKRDDVLFRMADALDNNSEATKKLADAFQAVVNNNNNIVENINKLNGFASDVYNRINNALMVIDALSICLFENKLIEESKFQEVMMQLAEQHEKRMREQVSGSKTECNCGGCENENKRKEDSDGAEKK